MGRIKNQFKYPIDRDITDDDYVIGSDSENGGKTVNFSVSSLNGNIIAGEDNVQSDWDETDVTSDAYIKNKPDINITPEFQYEDLDNIDMRFFWSSLRPRKAISSSRIGGTYSLLKVQLENYDLIKNNRENGEVYTLLIDRYRPQEYKGGSQFDSRRAGFRHELMPSLDGEKTNRINEIEILQNHMNLDFKQDFYFKPFNGKYDQHTAFPAPTGSSPNRSQSDSFKLGSKVRKGWVDLGFRIRVQIKDKILYETKHLGFIRMLGVSDFRQPRDERNFITYSVK